MTHLNLHQILNRLPFYLDENFITDDFIYIDVKYTGQCTSRYNYNDYTDEYLLTIHSPFQKPSSTYKIYVPVDAQGQCNRYEYDKIVAQIEPAIQEDYNNYKEAHNE